MKQEHKHYVKEELKHWKLEFDRLKSAYEELAKIYIMVEKARGNPKPIFHSVIDFNFADVETSEGVYANVIIDNIKGGIRSERVVDAVKDILNNAPK